jgi:PGF-CTERM protein
MVNKRLFSAVVAIAVILSIVGGSSIAFAQAPTSVATANATKVATANATKVATTAATTAAATTSKSSGFLGLPGFEAVYGVTGLLVVAYLILRRRT